MEISVRTQLDARAGLGEGPCWDSESGRLYWVDIDAGRIHATDPVTGNDRIIEAGEKIGAAVLASSGAIIAAGEHGFVEIAEGGGISKRIADPEQGNPDTRFNDGKCDPAGRFWAGTMSLSRSAGSAALYRLDSDGAVSKLVEGVTVSNGLAWDLEKSRMYYIDSPTKSVVAFDYRDEDGAISNPRIAFTTPPEMGSPDGMTIDSEGLLWIAFYRGGCVARWNPETGELLQRVDIPAPQVTSCCFGGGNLRTLFVTTARQGMDAAALERFPEAGGLFAFEPGVAGTPSYRYGG
jgi:sugar lactone lactonase YvrE